MRVGSLFSGIGCLELGVTAALDSLHVPNCVLWQAEADGYARAVLARHWPHTPCFKDVRDIQATTPRVDLVCGGFPCQDLSTAGRRAGITGSRSGLWVEFVRVVRVLRPAIVFVENVPGLAAYLDAVLGPLAELGFDAEWDLFDAAAVGAPHLRERFFLLAYAPGFRLEHRQPGEGQARSGHGRVPDVQRGPSGHGRVGPLPDAGSLDVHQQSLDFPRSADTADARGNGPLRPLAHAYGDGREVRRARESAQAPAAARRGALLGDPEGHGRGPARPHAGQGHNASAPHGAGRRWAPEPGVGRVVDGPSNRLDARRRRSRLRCLGNGAVWQQVDLAFVTLALRCTGLVAQREVSA